MDYLKSYLVYAARKNFLHDFNEKNWILLLHLKIGKQIKGKSSYLKDAIMLPTINCDTTKAATNVIVDFSFFIKSGKSIL